MNRLDGRVDPTLPHQEMTDMRKAMEELNADLELRNAQIQTLQKQITEAENSDANGGHHVAAGTGGSSKVGNVTFVIWKSVVSTFMRGMPAEYK